MSMSVSSLLDKDIPFQKQGLGGTYVCLPPPPLISQISGLAQSALVLHEKLAELRDPTSLAPRSISPLRVDAELPSLSQVLPPVEIEVEKKTDEMAGQVDEAPQVDLIDEAAYEQFKKTARKARRAKYVAEYRKTHGAKIASQHAEYYQAHRDEIASQHAEYRKAHRDEIAAQKVEYRKTHKAEIAAQKAQYRKTHKAKAKKD